MVARNTTSFSLKLAVLALGLGACACSAAVDAARLQAARALFNERGKSAEAQKAFEAIAAEEPGNVEAQLHLAQLALRREQADAALVHAQKAVQLAPQHAEAHRVLGDIYGRLAQKASVFSQLGWAKKCVAAYQKAVELAPDDVNCRYSLFEFYRQAPGFAGGGADKAAAEAATIKRLDPARGRFAFATLFVSEKKYAQALAEYDEALRANPDDYSALYQVGRIAAISGHALDRGLAALRRCLELTPPPQAPGHAAAQWRLGNLLEKKDDVPAARAAYQAALDLDPNFTAAAEALKKLK